jgi:hypothetical protein
VDRTCLSVHRLRTPPNIELFLTGFVRKSTKRILFTDKHKFSRLETRGRINQILEPGSRFTLSGWTQNITPNQQACPDGSSDGDQVECGKHEIDRWFCFSEQATSDQSPTETRLGGNAFLETTRLFGQENLLGRIGGQDRGFLLFRALVPALSGFYSQSRQVPRLEQKGFRGRVRKQ